MGRNVELMWLTGRLVPDHKTIADFRRDNGQAIRKVCGQFVLLCRKLGLFGEAVVAIDGSKFKAINNRYCNFTPAKMQRRIAEIEAAIRLYWTNSCGACGLKAHCTTGNQRRVRRWEHEPVLEAMEERIARRPDLMRL